MGKGGPWRLKNTLGTHLSAYAAKAKFQSNKSTPSLSKPSFAIWSYSLRAYCRLPREINMMDPERSMEFIRFLHIQMSSRRRNKAKTLRWDRSDRVLDRFDIYYGHGIS